MKLHTKFIIFIIALVAIVSLLEFAVSFIVFNKALETELEEKGEAIARSAGDLVATDMAHKDFAKVAARLHAVVGATGETFFIYVKDADNHILARAYAQDFLHARNAIARRGEKAPKKIDGLQPAPLPVLEVTAPLAKGLGGSIHVGLDRRHLQAHRRRLLQSLFLVFGVLIILGVSIGLALTRKYFAALTQMTENLNAYGRGDIDSIPDIPVREKELIVFIKSLREMTSLQERLTQDLIQNVEAQQVVNSLLQMALTPISLGKILKKGLEMILALPNFPLQPRGAIYLADKKSNLLYLKAQVGYTEGLLQNCQEIHIGSCICGQAASSRAVQFCDHITEDHIKSYDGMTEHGHYVVPICAGEELYGVINLYVNKGHCRNELEEKTLLSIANSLATIFEWKKVEKERQEMKDRLLHSQKLEAIGTLAGGIAHDFNNLLSAILGFTDLAMARASEESPQYKDLEQVKKAGRQATDLVRQILNFCRTSDITGFKPLQLQSIVKETVKLLKGTLPTTIVIHEKIDPHCSSILADPTKVHQAVMNLCTNAYHAMRENGGALTVELAELDIDATQAFKVDNLKIGKYVKLTINDTGHGIDQFILPHIFEPYFTTKKKQGGTGLGLANTYGIIKELGGAISVESRPGEGATFCLYFPAASDAPTDIDASADIDALEAEQFTKPIKARVLFVDDFEFNVLLGKSVLKKLGCNVSGHVDSREALELFRKAPQDFDAIITDQTMPKLTGFELSKEALAIRPEIPILLLTGYSETVDEAKAKAIGIKAFLYKPLEPFKLAKTLNEILN